MTFPFDKSTLIPYRKNQKWGYCNSQKIILLDCQFDAAVWFSEGFAAVKNGSKYGLIDERGNQVAPFLYDNIGVYSEGLVKIKMNSKYGFLDNNKKLVIPLEYDLAENFKNGLSRVMLKGKYGFIDHNGVSRVKCKYDFADNFSEGLSMVNVNGKNGFIDIYGHEVIPCIYDRAGNFSEGLAWVGIQEIGSPMKYGFVDKKGNIVIDIRYNWADDFQEGLAKVKVKNKKYPISNNNKGLGVSPARNDPYLRIFIDKEGNEILSLENENENAFYQVLSGVNNGLIIVGDQYCQEFINKHGEHVISLNYKYERVSSFSEGLALVVKNKRVLLTKDKYENKYGFINLAGEEFIPCEYDLAGNFNNGFAYARRDVNEGIEDGYIDNQGNEYWEGISRKYS